MQPHGNDLGPAEVFVLGPDFLNLDRLAGDLQRGQLRRRESFLDAVEEAAKVRAPINRQPAVERSFRGRARAKKFLEVVADSAAKRIARKGRIGTLYNLYGSFGQKLLEVRPKIIGYEVVGCPETRHGTGRDGHDRLLRVRTSWHITF